MNYFSKLKTQNLKPKAFGRQGGFTLLELLVVMGISTMMIGVLVIQQSKWNDSLVVNTQAYEMALMIRQAQIYSLGVKELSGGSGDKFDVGYGVHFDTDHTRYIFFADKDKDKKYDSGEEIEIKTFTRGVTIDKICGTAVGNDLCTMPLTQISISFFRPDTKAIISFLNPGGQIVAWFKPPAVIYLKSPGNKQYKVKIESSGQVAIVQI